MMGMDEEVNREGVQEKGEVKERRGRWNMFARYDEISDGFVIRGFVVFSDGSEQHFFTSPATRHPVNIDST
ncbi:unnamed protein product [Boreogadus saida]